MWLSSLQSDGDTAASQDPSRDRFLGSLFVLTKGKTAAEGGKKTTQPLPGLISRTANGSGEKHYRKFTARESQLGFQTIIPCKSEVESSASRKISVGDWALKIQVVFEHFTSFFAPCSSHHGSLERRAVNASCWDPGDSSHSCLQHSVPVMEELFPVFN